MSVCPKLDKSGTLASQTVLKSDLKNTTFLCSILGQSVIFGTIYNIPVALVVDISKMIYRYLQKYRILAGEEISKFRYFHMIVKKENKEIFFIFEQPQTKQKTTIKHKWFGTSMIINQLIISQTVLHHQNSL